MDNAKLREYIKLSLAARKNKLWKQRDDLKQVEAVRTKRVKRAG
jgi:hypothetical protein